MIKKKPSLLDEQATIAHLLQDLCDEPHVKQMNRYIQHGNVTTYDHCCRVVRLSFRINRRLRLGANERTLMRGAMLHDFYLYDWHKKDGGSHRWHGFIHAKRAAENAKKYFSISSDEEQIIYCHMWPLNITRIPRSREAWIVCVADKMASLKETVFSM